MRRCRQGREQKRSDLSPSHSCLVISMAKIVIFLETERLNSADVIWSACVLVRKRYGWVKYSTRD